MCATVPHGGANLARCRQRANPPPANLARCRQRAASRSPLPRDRQDPRHTTSSKSADRLTNTEWMINLCNYDHGRHHDGQLAITGDPDGVITSGYRDGRELRSPTRPVMKNLRNEPDVNPGTRGFWRQCPKPILGTQIQAAAGRTRSQPQGGEATMTTCLAV